MDLSFLKTVVVKEVEAKGKVSRVSLEKYPVEGADFRVYKNGRIFPSLAAAAEFKLDFGPKLGQEEEGAKAVTVGNGLDIFSSENWQMMAIEETVLFVAVVPRYKNSKIDVYGSTSYEEDGAPKRSIDANSVSAFGSDTLIGLLEEVYDVDFEANDYVDLVLNADYQIKSPGEVYSIPKIVSRGDNKGQPVFVTRVGIAIFPLTVFETPEEATAQVDLEEAIEEVTSPKDTVGATEDDGSDDPNPIKAVAEAGE